jgi:nucleoside-diphosphate-sugar epimerase
MSPGHTLVTGATGGLGRVLVRALIAAEHAVLATGRNAQIGAQLAKDGAHFVAADLARDDLSPLLAGTHTVIHLAALSAPWGRDADFAAANVTATQRLLAAARTAPQCRQFLFASTPSIYTAPRDQLGLREDSPLPPRLINAYARTKYAAECAVLAANGAGLRTMALRPRAIICPGDMVLLPRLIRAAGRGRMPLPHGGRALIELTDARDVAAAFIAALQGDDAAYGRAYNLSGGAPLPLATIAGHVFQRLGRQVQMIGINRHIALAGAGLLERIAHLRRGQPEPAITRYGVMATGWSQTFDLSAVHTALGWQPRHAPREAIDWALGGLDDA